jgi:hypothetical protein
MSSKTSSAISSHNINVDMTYPLISQERVWKLFAFPVKGYKYPWPQTVCGTLSMYLEYFSHRTYIYSQSWNASLQNRTHCTIRTHFLLSNSLSRSRSYLHPDVRTPLTQGHFQLVPCSYFKVVFFLPFHCRSRNCATPRLSAEVAFVRPEKEEQSDWLV